ncbi:MAG: phosphoenolpyruvate carboxykinase (GTP), partial [Microbacterium gubbeenense]
MSIAEPTTLAHPTHLAEYGTQPEYGTAAFGELVDWVNGIAALTKPDRIHWVDGSESERQALRGSMVAQGTLIKLNEDKRPNSYLARSGAGDVARLESRTFIASEHKTDAGPTNNWADPAEMRATLDGVFDGSMRGRTMFVVPFSMGKVGGPISQLGVQLTDSPYAVASVEVMTRVGDEITELIADGTPWVRTVHSIGHPLELG